jgi:hypothetical protein
LLKNLLTMLVTLVILFGLLEVAVRVFVDESLYLFSDASEDWELDDDLGWKHLPNHHELKRVGDQMILFETNEDGFRPATATRQKPEGTRRLMLFGNSTVVARDVPVDQNLHYYLDSLLNRNGEKFDVVNAGVSAYATDLALLAIKKYLKVYKPDVVCYGFCVNDLYANTQGNYWEISKPHFALENGGLKFIPNQPEKSRLPNQGSYLAPKHLIQRSALYGLLRPHIQKVRIMLSEQALLDQGGGSDLSIYKQKIDGEPLLLLLEKLIVEMQRACRENGVEFFFYAHPEVITVWKPYREAIGQQNVEPLVIENKLGEIADRNGIKFLRMVPHFLKNESRGPFHLLPNDPHCNGAGYLLQAEVMSAYVQGIFFEKTTGKMENTSQITGKEQ